MNPVHRENKTLFARALTWEYNSFGSKKHEDTLIFSPEYVPDADVSFITTKNELWRKCKNRCSIATWWRKLQSLLRQHTNRYVSNEEVCGRVCSLRLSPVVTVLSQTDQYLHALQCFEEF